MPCYVGWSVIGEALVFPQHAQLSAHLLDVDAFFDDAVDAPVHREVIAEIEDRTCASRLLNHQLIAMQFTGPLEAWRASGSSVGDGGRRVEEEGENPRRLSRLFGTLTTCPMARDKSKGHSNVEFARPLHARAGIASGVGPMIRPVGIEVLDAPVIARQKRHGLPPVATRPTHIEARLVRSPGVRKQPLHDLPARD